MNQELTFKGTRLSIDIASLTKPCEKEEQQLIAQMKWLHEKNGMQQVDKYMADPEQALANCYRAHVLPRLQSLIN